MRLGSASETGGGRRASPDAAGPAGIACYRRLGQAARLPERPDSLARLTTGLKCVDVCVCVRDGQEGPGGPRGFLPLSPPLLKLQTHTDDGHIKLGALLNSVFMGWFQTSS